MVYVCRFQHSQCNLIDLSVAVPAFGLGGGGEVCQRGGGGTKGLKVLMVAVYVNFSACFCQLQFYYNFV